METNEIKILVINEDKTPRNYFVLDKIINKDVSLPPPPKTF